MTMVYSEVSDEEIKRELNSSTQEKLPFFICRLPGTEKHIVAHGVREEYGHTLSPGINMVPFDNRSGRHLVFGNSGNSTSEADSRQNEEDKKPFFDFPEHDTTKEEHISRVSQIVERLRRRKALGIDAKTVSARLKGVSSDKQPAEIYLSLCEAYPDTFTFLCDSVGSGIWIGASPELLCKVKGDEVSTMALAGTRPAGSQGDWDPKNMEEHTIVVRYISGALEKYCHDICTTSPYTRKAGPVEHLCTDFKARLPLHTSPEKRMKAVAEIVNTLSPTPALCGYPVQTAMRDIKETEDFDRGFYGGYIAVVAENGDADIYVNLRSMMMRGEKAFIIAGGGIMADSVPEKEWEETERKASTLERIL